MRLCVPLMSKFVQLYHHTALVTIYAESLAEDVHLVPCHLEE